MAAGPAAASADVAEAEVAAGPAAASADEAEAELAANGGSLPARWRFRARQPANTRASIFANRTQWRNEVCLGNESNTTVMI